jgi:DNA polymerase IV
VSAPDVVAGPLLHVDMDAFFAAVEVLDDPTLVGRAVVVGGAGRRGVVASCTYEARAYGVHSAMPSVEARRRCPEAVFVSGHYGRYAEVSGRLFDVLGSFTPLVEGVGLDEAFLDVAGARRLLGEPATIGAAVRVRVREELGLSCSVGVARTKLLAKLASRAAKPRPSPRGTEPGPGVYAVAAADEVAFLHPMPIRALWGVGPATARRLEDLGLTTVGELARVPADTVRRAVGDSAGRQLAALAQGEDARRVDPQRPVRSIGHEQTFAEDHHDHRSLHDHVVRMSDAVGARLHEARTRGRTITLKVRFADRRTITRSHTVADPTASSRALVVIADALLQGIEVSEGVRLLGISVSGLGPDGAANGDCAQLSFVDSPGDAGATGTASGVAPDPAEAWPALERAVADIRLRYGQRAVGPAALVGPAGLELRRPGDVRWGPDA